MKYLLIKKKTQRTYSLLLWGEMVYLHNAILLSHKKENFTFGKAWMDLENIVLSEISQSEKDKYHMTSLICGI